MTKRIRQEIKELREGMRILFSREFWDVFRTYWAPSSVARRMDEWTSRYRDDTGMDPDWTVERRIAERRKKDVEGDS